MGSSTMGIPRKRLQRLSCFKAPLALLRIFMVTLNVFFVGRFSDFNEQRHHIPIKVSLLCLPYQERKFDLGYPVVLLQVPP